MKIEIHRQWHGALRSGLYKQTTETLYDPEADAYCCLGVLCDLYLKEHPDITMEALQEEALDGHGGEVLPERVQQWAGIESPDSENPKIDGIALSSYNDGAYGPNRVEPHSFGQIADLIEAHPEI